MTESVDPLRGKIILLIDTNEFLADFISKGLKLAGAQILGPARSVNEANELLSRLRSSPNAAVISVSAFEATGFVAGDILARLGVPMLLIAGTTRTLMPSTFRHRVLTTPFAAYQVVDHVCAILRTGATQQNITD